MADKPILFSGPMVRALLEGRKTQTRRVLKPQPPEGSTFFAYDHGDNGFYARFLLEDERGNADLPFAPLKFMAGDRLWVREAWRTEIGEDNRPPRDLCSGGVGISYEATPREPILGRLRASMHMPRWASRLTLVVTDVQVQRLQDISRGDAMAEGRPHPNMAAGPNPVYWFYELWNGLNADRDFGWDANPWVAAYTFTVHKCNIDQMGDV